MTETKPMTRIELIRSNPVHAKSGKDLSAAGLLEMPLESPTIDRTTRLVSGMLTTSDVDAEGDIIDPDGIDLDTYYPNKVKAVYWNHDYHAPPLGTCRRLVRKGKALWQQTYIKPGAFGDEILICIEAGCVAHMSIGFIPEETREPTAMEYARFPEARRVVSRCMALEGSIVAMPANAAAKLDELVVKGLITRASAHRLGLPEERVAGVRKRVVLDTKHWLLTNQSGQVSVL